MRLRVTQNPGKSVGESLSGSVTRFTLRPRSRGWPSPQSPACSLSAGLLKQEAHAEEFSSSRALTKAAVTARVLHALRQQHQNTHWQIEDADGKAADEPLMSGGPDTLNHENGLDSERPGEASWKGRGNRVDLRNGEEEIPADDEPDPAKVIVP